MGRGGWRHYTLVAVVAAAALAVFGALYGWLPWLIDGTRLHGLSLKDQTGVLSSDRGDVLKMVAGAGALVALVYTARKHTLDREGQVTDRYSKAITQLASERESERVGGIYALERIMADSARDHHTVVEVLAAFVRQRAKRSATASDQSPIDESEGTQRPEADVQAAMTVLARRPKRDELVAIDLRRIALAGLELPDRARLAGVNFEHASLVGIRLPGATLAGAKLTGADLREANLDGANLTKAELREADLTKTGLNRANLTEANLYMAKLADADLANSALVRATLFAAQLTNANLSWSNLTDANLDGAKLIGSNITGANLTNAYGLSIPQLADAFFTASTKLDKHLAENAYVRSRAIPIYRPGRKRVQL